MKKPMTRILSRRFACGASLVLSLIVLLTVCAPHRLQAEFLENWFQAQPPENDPTGAWAHSSQDFTGRGHFILNLPDGTVQVTSDLTFDQFFFVSY